MVKDVAASEADPYLIVGALIEGIAHTIDARIPMERRSDTIRASVALLIDRLRGSGLV